jgi:hypothetical protein
MSLCIRSREHRVAGHPILGELAGHRKKREHRKADRKLVAG